MKRLSGTTIPGFFSHFLRGIALLMLLVSLGAAQLPGDTIPPVPQRIINEEDFNQRIENMAEEAETEQDYSELIEDLEYLIQRPMNLNNASSDDLRRLPFLNEIQIANLLNHISMFGRLISIYELQSIEGFDMQTISSIQPYVTVSEETGRRHFGFDDILREGSSQLFVRYQRLVEEQKGFSQIEQQELEENPNTRYPGSPYRLYTRYRFTYYNNISLGVTAEKDPG